MQNDIRAIFLSPASPAVTIVTNHLPKRYMAVTIGQYSSGCQNGEPMRSAKNFLASQPNKHDTHEGNGTSDRAR